jgi:hypothetical protein
MRKLSIFLIALSLGMLGCKDDNSGTSTSVPPPGCDCDSTEMDLSSVPQLSQQEVQDMVNKWAGKPSHLNSEIVQQITMDGNILRKFIKKGDQLKSYMAAYLKDEGGHKEGETTIVISRIRGKDRVYYDFNAFFHTYQGSRPSEQEGGSLCPPPSNCDFPFIGPAAKASDSTKPH